MDLAMTIINRFCPEIADILAIRIECKQCGAAISYPKGEWTPGFLQCPSCKTRLITGSTSEMSEELQALQPLAEGLRLIWKNHKDLRFNIRLEFDQH
jgi:hypothetical protein